MTTAIYTPSTRTSIFDHRTIQKALTSKEETKLDKAKRIIKEQNFHIDALQVRNQALKLDNAALEKELSELKASGRSERESMMAQIAQLQSSLAIKNNLIHNLRVAVCAERKAVEKEEREEQPVIKFDHASLVNRRHEAVDIIKVISEYTKISMEEMRSLVRTRHLVYARHLVCYFAAHFSHDSFNSIADMITGKRDNTYVLNGKNVITERMQKQPEVVEDVQRIAEILNSL